MLCDYDPPAIYTEKHRVARKKHQCCECGSDIDPGEKYQVINGLWDGEWSEFKTCTVCEQIRYEALSKVDCCIPLGGLYNEIGSAFEDVVELT